jgi:hypothetical protein
MRQTRALLLALLLVQASPVAALDPGIARGELRVDGEAVVLTHAYALHQDNAEGVLEGPELRILLADRDIPPGAIAGPLPWALERMARAGALRGVLLKLSPEPSPQAVNGLVLYPPATPQAALAFFTAAGFKRLERDGQWVAGEIEHASEPHAGSQGVPAFRCEASFRAPVFEDVPVEADLRGRAARKSEPAQAFLAYEEALRSGVLARVEPLVTPAKYQELAAFASQAGEARVRSQAGDAVPPRDARKRQIGRVVVRGARATVIFTDPEGKGYQSLVRVNGDWRVD